LQQIIPHRLTIGDAEREETRPLLEAPRLVEVEQGESGIEQAQEATNGLPHARAIDEGTRDVFQRAASTGQIHGEVSTQEEWARN
jgi:hypothetical protein